MAFEQPLKVTGGVFTRIPASEDVALNLLQAAEVIVGTLTISPAIAGDILRWSATATPVAVGDLGMDVVTGRPLAFIDSAVRSLAYVGEAPGGGITEAQHKALRNLIHFIDEGPAEGFASLAFKEILPVGALFPTSVIWWEAAAKTQKIVEQTIAYAGILVSSIVWKMYSTDGITVLATVTDAIVYSGLLELSRTRTIA